MHLTNFARFKQNSARYNNSSGPSADTRRSDDHRNSENFLVSAMERMQRDLSDQLTKQIQAQFQKMQEENWYNTEYPDQSYHQSQGRC